MCGFVYVLFSFKDHKTYVGSTDNLERRIFEHKNAKVTSTKNRLPIKLIYSKHFNELIEARKMEKYYKTCSGRKKLAIILSSILPTW